MKVGYVRVSTVEQNLARQLELMKTLGVEKIYCDKMSGKNTERTEFKEMMEFLREGDTLYVESFSRLSRSTLDFLNTVSRLQAKSVNLVSDKEKMDMSTPQGKFMVTVFAALSELERTVCSRDSGEGIEVAKAEGKYKGRKPFPPTKSSLRWPNAWAGGKIALQRRNPGVWYVLLHFLSQMQAV